MRTLYGAIPRLPDNDLGAQRPVIPVPVGLRRARDPIKGLPAGVRVYRVKVKGVEYWRARLRSRFTGGHVQVKHFQALEDARKWVFGDAQKKKAETGLSLIDLKARAGATAFVLTPAQIAEAIDAFKRLEGADLTLTEAVGFALEHSRPAAGVISVAEAIEKAVVRKQSRRPTYLVNLKTRWRRFERWLLRAKKKALHMVTQADIRRYLDHCNLKPKGEDNERRNLSVLFGWAVQHHFIASNPNGMRSILQEA